MKSGQEIKYILEYSFNPFKLHYNECKLFKYIKAIILLKIKINYRLNHG